VALGTPNVTFLVALDTGSDLFWVPCDCINCAPLVSPNYRVLPPNQIVCNPWTVLPPNFHCVNLHRISSSTLTALRSRALAERSHAAAICAMNRVHAGQQAAAAPTASNTCLITHHPPVCWLRMSCTWSRSMVGNPKSLRPP
jgi:hypothetical protein